MKKHFQYASAQAGNTVHYVEVECSAAGDTCAQFDVKGYPSVRLLAKTGDKKYKVYTYDGARTHGPLLEFGRNALEVAKKGKFSKYKGIIPDISKPPAPEEEAEEEDDEDDEDDDENDEL